MVADFAAPVRKVWDAYLDPRKIERFWGPPGYPARFLRHDGSVGGRSEYTMPTADGEATFVWLWLAVDEGKSFEVRDGDGLLEGGPGSMVVRFEETATGSRTTVQVSFASVDDLEDHGSLMGQGIAAAGPQLDALLDES